MATFRWRVGAADGLADLAADDWETNALPTVVQHVRAKTPIESGQLAASIRNDARAGSGRRTSWTIRARAINHEDDREQTNYAQIVALGHGEIVPKVAKVLRWMNRQGWHAASRVRPVKGFNYLYAGLKSAGLKSVRKTVVTPID